MEEGGRVGGLVMWAFMGRGRNRNMIGKEAVDDVSEA